MKERLYKVKPQSYFDGLEDELKLDISRHYKIARQKGCKDVL